MIYPTHLVEPYAIAGFFGSSNIEGVATETIKYLHNRLHPRLVGKTSEKYYVHSLTHPDVVIENGVMTGIKFPVIEAYSKEEDGTPRHDLVILSGKEKDNWGRGSREVIDLLTTLGVKRIITVGGVHQAIPHTRDPYIYGAVNNASLKGLLEKANVRYGNLNSSSSFNAVLLSIAARRGLDGIGLAVGIPDYWQYFSVGYPRGSQMLLRTLEKMLDIDFDSGSLGEDVFVVDQDVAKIMERNPTLKERLLSLENSYDKKTQVEEDSMGVRRILDFLENPVDPT